MTTFCLFCNKAIPKNRKKYCSVICIKHAWYVRNLNPNCRSYFAKNPDFWKTETGIGLKWEKYAARLLDAKHLMFNKNGCDLDWNGKMIDVKSAHLWKRKFKRGTPVTLEQYGVWVFNRGKDKPVDFFLCIALLKDKPFKKLLIPATEFPRSGIVMGEVSKYDRFSL